MTANNTENGNSSALVSPGTTEDGATPITPGAKEALPPSPDDDRDDASNELPKAATDGKEDDEKATAKVAVTMRTTM